MQTANLFSNELGGGMMLSWGGVVGSQNSGFEDHFGHQLKSAVASKEKSTAKFTIFPGDGQNSAYLEKLWLQKSDSIPIAIIDNPKHLELGFPQPMICSGFPHEEKYSGGLSTYGSQLTGRVMLPLNSETDEGAIFVNAKQYKGIIRRRMYRAKAELKNKVLKKTSLIYTFHDIFMPCVDLEVVVVAFLTQKNLVAAMINTPEEEGFGPLDPKLLMVIIHTHRAASRIIQLQK